MQVDIKLFAGFRIGRFNNETRELLPDMTVVQIVRELGIPERHLGMVLVSDRRANLDQVLKDGDVLSLFPVIGGG